MARYFKVDVADLLVVVDEVHLPLGKTSGESAGIGRRAQRAEVGDRARGEEFPGLRLGVGRGEFGRRDLADHVLSRFESDERAEVDRMITRAADAAEMFVTGGIAAVMNQFNGGDPATTE